MIVCAAQFARKTGFPLATIRRWCNLGYIAHWRLGRKMLFDDEKALRAIELLKESPPGLLKYHIGKPGRKPRSQYSAFEIPPPDGHGAERLKELLKSKRACAAANGASPK